MDINSGDNSEREYPVKALPFLDSLRGLAAVGVLICHTFAIPQPRLNVPGWIESIANIGESGVALFFIVSAFSLFYTMPAYGQEGPVNLKWFYLRRFFRIAPLFYFVTVCTIFREGSASSVGYSNTNVAANFLFIFNLIPGLESGIAWASWTIGVEMLFYLILPIFYRDTTNLKKAFAIFFASLFLWLAITSLIKYGIPEENSARELLNFNFFRYLPIFLLGIVSYFIFKDHVQGKLINKRISAGLLLGAFAGFFVLIINWHDNFSGGAEFLIDWFQWQGIFHFLFFLAIAIHPMKIFVNRVTQFYGKISYSLYLTHPMIIFYSIPLYRKIYALGYSNSLSFLLAFGYTLTIMTLVSVAAYRLIEQPGIQLGKLLMRRLKLSGQLRSL